MTLVAVIAGILVGLSLGALGGGGAIVTVPALVYGLSQTAHQATTGSLVIVGLSSAVAVVAHARKGNVRWKQGAVFGLLGTAGTVVGARVSDGLDSRVLLLAFALLLVLVAVSMWRRDSRSGSAAEPRAPHVGVFVLTTLGVGLLTGFFGVGGGFAIVPALVLVLGFPMPVAVGTSLVVIVINSASALVARLGSGVSLDWAMLAVFTAAAIAGSLLGARAASRVEATTLQRAFALLLAAVAVYTGLRSGAALMG